MNNKKYPLIVYIYNLSYKILYAFIGFIKMCFTGFWLGVLERKTLHDIDAFYYDRHDMYCDEKYNRIGFYGWEQKMLDDYFKGCKKLLVISAGGGREVLALRRLGYETDGFECNPKLVKCANDLLKKEGFVPNIQEIMHDQCPEAKKIYDGIIVGWTAYALIQGKKQRIAFLRNLRKQTKEKSPILISFFKRTKPEYYYSIIITIGNTFKRMLGKKDYLETGDDILLFYPNYTHSFSNKEIKSELSEGGFELGFYSTHEYAHAVGIAT